MSSRRAVLGAVTVVVAFAGCLLDPMEPEDGQKAAVVPAAAARRMPSPGDNFALLLEVRGAPPANVGTELLGAGADFVTPRLPNGMYGASINRALLNKFRRMPWIRIVEVDSTTRAYLTDDTIPWGVDSIGAISIQTNYANTGAGIKVGVIDDGMFCSHPDLDDNLYGGYDYVSNSSNYCAGGSHGTRVAGVIAAEDNGSGVIGVAPGAHLYSYRACAPNGANKVVCDPVPLAASMIAAVGAGVQVVNLSVAYCGDAGISELVEIGLDAMHDAGVVVVASAGNGLVNGCDDQTLSPLALYRDAIVVSAYGTYTDSLSQGSGIDLAGPTNVLTDSGSSSTAYIGRTSGAVPHVTGTVALLLKAGFSGVSNIKQRMTSTAMDIGTSGFDNRYGNGLVQASPAATPKPVVDSITWCTGTGLTSAGYCTFTAHGRWGVETLQYRFTVRASTSPNDSTVYGWGSSSQSINVAAGTYALEVRVEARDASPYLRVGPSQYQYVPVCTGQSFLRDPESPDSEIGCGGGGGDDIQMDPNENPWGGSFLMLPRLPASTPVAKTRP